MEGEETMNIVSARCVIDTSGGAPGFEVIDIIRHPDRSAAEWRDLLFVWVSTHATASRLAREFRDRTHAIGKLDKRAIYRGDSPAAAVRRPRGRSSTPPQ